MCLYQKFISRFTYTLIIIPDCFLIFWFCIKRNQVYYTWFTYTPIFLVSIQLLFCHCMKYVKVRTFSDPYFPAFGQNIIFLYLDRIYDIRDLLFLNTGKYRSDSVHIQKNIDQTKSIFWHISHSVLLIIFSCNLNLRTQIYKFCQCPKIICANI